ncbi:hypothetical protein HOY80DRAFT_566795 [Tuber brumale]|nr:hypothetical protein HOY80DRAFT_566795 [Tuber brumale]
MSSTAIFIPNRPGDSSPSSSTSSEAPSPSASPATPPAGASGSPPPSRLPSSSSIYHRRRPSLLSSSVSRVEHSVFDLGIRDGSPRLITCVKASQGFDWNQDIFLPSSSEITIHNGIQKPETVHEIILSEDESFLPS